MNVRRSNFGRFLGRAILLLAAGLGGAHSASAQVGELTGNLLQDVAIEQRLNAQAPLDLEFRDHTGRSVELSELLDDRPAILNLVYFRCPRLCKLTTDGLLRTLQTLPLTVGEEFQVLTVSFDPREGPEEARASRRMILKLYERDSAASGWHFLTAEADVINRLTSAVGFRVAYDREMDQFAHAAGIIVLTPQGRVSHYLNGVEFPARDVRLALVEASGNQIGSPTDQVLLFCYQYNAKIGKYTFAVVRLLQVCGVATVLTLATGIAMMLRRDPLRNAAGNERDPPTA